MARNGVVRAAQNTCKSELTVMLENNYTMVIFLAQKKVKKIMLGFKAATCHPFGGFDNRALCGLENKSSYISWLCRKVSFLQRMRPQLLK